MREHGLWLWQYFTGRQKRNFRSGRDRTRCGWAGAVVGAWWRQAAHVCERLSQRGPRRTGPQGMVVCGRTGTAQQVGVTSSQTRAGLIVASYNPSSELAQQIPNWELRTTRRLIEETMRAKREHPDSISTCSAGCGTALWYWPGSPDAEAPFSFFLFLLYCCSLPPSY
jgi:hypothetical protein